MNRMAFRTLAPLLLWRIRPRDNRISVRLEGDGRVGDMRLMIWRIEILAVPTGGESDSRTYAAGALVVGERGSIVPGAGSATKGVLIFEETAVADAARFTCFVAEHGIAGEHAKALFSFSLPHPGTH